MGHTKLEGIYIYPYQGCLVEFTRNDQERKTQALKLYTVSSTNSNLYEDLPEMYPDIKWETDQRYYSDKTEYFKSTKPATNNDYLFFSGFDYSEEAKKRKNTNGNNNCNRVLSLEISIGENLYSKIDEKLFMFDKNENKDCCEYRINNKDKNFILYLYKMENNTQNITITFEALDEIDPYEGQYIKGYNKEGNYILNITNK